DGVIAHAAVEYVAEDYRGTSRRREGEAEAAALAGVVMRDARVRDGRAVIGRPRKGKRGADILFVPLARRHAIALVEPGGEQRAVGIERDRLEALAFLVGGDRTRRREAAATVGRARVKNLAVELAVAEAREGDEHPAVLVNGDLRARVGAPVEIER